MSVDHANADSPKPQSKVRFRLWTLVILIGVCCIVLGLVFSRRALVERYLAYRLSTATTYQEQLDAFSQTQRLTYWYAVHCFDENGQPLKLPTAREDERIHSVRIEFDTGPIVDVQLVVPGETGLLMYE